MTDERPTTETTGSSNDQAADGGGFSRRRFVRTVGTGALVGAVGSAGVTPAMAQTDGSWLERDGTDLVIDGEQAYFHGANNFWITDGFRNTKSRIDDLFAMFDETGIDLLRTFIACEGGDGDCFVPEQGTHNESAYQRLDYLISKASEHGIKIVFALADNWDHNGGIPQIVDWLDETSVHGDFFAEQAAWDYYKWHVEETLTRTNTVTGVEYRNDPTIAAWELCNEPRIEGDAFGEGEDPGYEERATILEEWITEMSGFITDLDPNHLISTGMEGFYTRDDRTEWFYNTWTGQDFLRHHDVDDVDLCSFHTYPYWWNFPTEYGPTWLREHVRDAHEELGKPAYAGEFNVADANYDVETKNEYLREWYDALAVTDCDAASIWQVVLESTHDHDPFQVYRSESGDVLDAYRQAVAAKSESDFVTGGSGPGLVAPPAVVAHGRASAVDVVWSGVNAASEYVVTVDGEAATTTSATRATVTGLAGETEYEVGVAAVGPDGTQTAATTTAATTVDASNVGYPEWERGTVYQSGDRVVWNGIVWEANWYTDEEEPRFESGYAWSFVEVVGTAGDDAPTEPPTATPTPEPDGPPAVGENENRPTDPDEDGLYEDVNGDGATNLADAGDLFQSRNEDAVGEHVSAYDFSGNGEVDLADVVQLFQENT